MESEIVTSPSQDQAPMAPYPAMGKKFGPRAVAWLIDQLFVFLAISVIKLVAGLFFGIALALTGTGCSLVDMIPGAAIALAYMVSFEALYGASIGKLILGMRVIKMDGALCDFRAALVRGLYRFIDGIFFGIPAYLSMKEPPYQRLGDKSANTLVVGSRDERISESREWWRLVLALVIFASIAAIALMISTMFAIILQPYDLFSR